MTETEPDKERQSKRVKRAERTGERSAGANPGEGAGTQKTTDPEGGKEADRRGRRSVAEPRGALPAAERTERSTMRSAESEETGRPARRPKAQRVILETVIYESNCCLAGRPASPRRKSGASEQAKAIPAMLFRRKGFLP